ncbi:hypothetical protein EYZ11_008983 [Aspergillus tanneri]|uniref:Cation-transporting ATPase n=1 Tax=Aspergillus tanneri TaxID=1220188 RepID=A0A4V3UNL0_9EURO|nr:hypothetical protein EYZ11_008983 [Aspergillus tanneri]
MARSEVFDGPISESIPSSVASFSYRGHRNNSTVSFTYLEDEEDFAREQNEDALGFGSEIDEEVNGVRPTSPSTISSFASKRQPRSRNSVEDPLLPHQHSSDDSYVHNRRPDGRHIQKVYIESEDLTIVLAGFSTSVAGLSLYYALCFFSFGLTYLDQWGQFSIYEVRDQAYGRPLSTIFAHPEYQLYDEENDPTISFLRYIDYKYLRLFYHQLDDRFCLITGWKDPLWTHPKMMRVGLDADDRDTREQIFGKNIIDIQQKPAFQLLIDEVSVAF